MIYSVQGTLLSRSPFSCVVLVAGTGLSLEFRIPLSTYEKLPEVGGEVTLYVQAVTSAKSGQIVLYGFLRREERFIFQKLLDMPGVGPSLALRLLSGMSPEALVEAADRGDVRKISGIKGVGRKRAERIAFELKERLPEIREVMELSEESVEPQVHPAPVSDIILGAIEALVALGLKRSEAEAAVNTAASTLKDDFTIEELIRRALSSRRG